MESNKDRLRKAIAQKREARLAKKTDNNGKKIVTKSQSVDSIMESLGLKDNAEVKQKLIRAMRMGEIKNVNQLSEWLSLNAPIATGLDPMQAIHVNEMLKQSNSAANSYTDRLVNKTCAAQSDENT